MNESVDTMQKEIVKMMSVSNLNMMERAAVITSVMYVHLNFKSNKEILSRLGISTSMLTVEAVTAVQQLLTLQYMESNSFIDNSDAVINEAEQAIAYSEEV